MKRYSLNNGKSRVEMEEAGIIQWNIGLALASNPPTTLRFNIPELGGFNIMGRNWSWVMDSFTHPPTTPTRFLLKPLSSFRLGGAYRAVLSNGDFG